MKDPIQDIDRPLDRPTRYLVPHPATWRDYSCCPWAKTVIAIDPETENPIVCPVTCKRWGCPYCAVRKIRKLAYLTNQAVPNRWIRLGVNPRNYTGPKDAWQRTSALVPELFRLMRKIFNKEVEYLRVTEIHDGKHKPEDSDRRKVEGPMTVSAIGFPHYHALLRSPYIPHPVMSREWARLTALPWPGREQLPEAVKDLDQKRYHTAKLKDLMGDSRTEDDELQTAWCNATGAPYIWIAAIKQTFSSFRYMTKYLTKLHKIEWTNRHVSYSRGFFTPESQERLAFPERTIIERSDEHPWLYLSRRFHRDTVGLDDNGCYHLNELFCGTPMDLCRADVGLPDLPDKTEPPPPPKVQRTLVDDLTRVDIADKKMDFAEQSF